MAFEQVAEAFEVAIPAGADLRSNLHYIVKLDTSGNVVLAAAATDALLGVIREVGNTGEPITVQYGGIAKVFCGATITAGARVTTDGSGKLAAATSGNTVLGVLLSTGAGANDIVSVALVSGSV